MKILTVIGARPQFIKAAVVSREITKHIDIDEYIVHTGQHYDKNMSEVFFSELDIPNPNVNLEIGSGLQGEQTAKMLAGIESEIIKQQPACVLVYGDTNSTLAGALASAKLNIPVCHVEAGLRSFNRKMPEEVNRILTDHASDLLCTPTSASYNQLVSEGIDKNKIIQSGDVMLDASIYYTEKAELNSQITTNLELTDKNYVLATLHRAENTDSKSRLHMLIEELDTLANSTTVILPLHPRTKAMLSKFHIPIKNIQIIEPIGYLDMIKLQQNSSLIVTDSGGIQKEAFFHKKPCITLRNETEWTELLETGWNILYLPTSEQKVSLTELAESQISKKLSEPPALYGSGLAAQKIVKSIFNNFVSTKQ